MHIQTLLCLLCGAKAVLSNNGIIRNISNDVQQGVKFLESIYIQHFSVNAILAKELQGVIIPGTRWCGPGDLATSYEDLGKLQDIDRCCREHDSCPKYLEPGDSKYGLVNLGFYTWSHCDCDRQFHTCLKTVGSIVSDLIGFGYFTVLGSKCFKEDFPIVRCKKCKITTLAYKKRDRRKCLEYDLDEKGVKKYQWFDNPLYYD